MPKQRTNYFRDTHDFPNDFPQRLARFREASGLSWAEFARRLGTVISNFKMSQNL